MGYTQKPQTMQDEFGPCCYRTEGFAGEGYRDPEAVMAHETVELGNSGCVEYMLWHYLLEDTPLMEKAWAIWSAVENDNAKTLETEDVEAFFSECLWEIERLTGKAITFVLWLARRDVVKDFYGHGIEELEIDQYDTENAVILDDLGYDGRLYGFESPVKPVKREVAKKES